MIACAFIIVTLIVPVFAITASLATAQTSPGASYYVEEKMLVKEGSGEWFVEYWLTKVLPVFAALDGYLGYTIATTIGDPALTAEQEDFGPILPLGPPDETFIEHGGLQLRGTVTNTMIHFDSLLRGTYNFKVTHYWADAHSLQGLVPQFGPIWTELHGDENPCKILETEYFFNLENHWDTVYRVVEKPADLAAVDTGETQ